MPLNLATDQKTISSFIQHSMQKHSSPQTNNQITSNIMNHLDEPDPASSSVPFFEEGNDDHYFNLRSSDDDLMELYHNNTSD